jgi:D-glycero-alpha-D-manno-heptose-7-phosphate kinase
MIVTRCPLRISLVGGSSDLQPFLDKYEWGSVISFPANLYTYITLKKRLSDYKIVYSQIEHVSDPSSIKNDIAREVLYRYNVNPVEISFNSDIPSHGSGLATSTSYLIALIEAVNKFENLKLSKFEVCKSALEIERRFNPLTGYQDSYGCGIGGFKRLFFKKDGSVTIKYLSNNAIRQSKFILVSTETLRSSTKILSTLDIDTIVPIRNLTDKLEQSIENIHVLNSCINDSWLLKKMSSSDIMTPDLITLENKLVSTNGVYSRKLLGAGGGGYFLIVGRVDDKELDKLGIVVYPDEDGVKVIYEN